MPIVELTLEGTVAVITMNNGENRQNLAFAQAMEKALDEALAETSVTAIVLTSAGDKYFSAGVDLEWMMDRFSNNALDDMRSFMYGMNAVFKKCLLAPVPVIAAINGAAAGAKVLLVETEQLRYLRDEGVDVDLRSPIWTQSLLLTTLSYGDLRIFELGLRRPSEAPPRQATRLLPDPLFLNRSFDSPNICRPS